MIDVGLIDPTQNPRLYVTKGETGLWAALSYCWGGSSAFVLKSTNIDQFRTGEFSTDNYPPTLMDAVFITRKLKIQYLWIDSLCIMQDSPEDWAQESARMKDVYGGAMLTIVAMGSSTVEAGMLRDRSISTEVCMIEWKSTKTTSGSNVFIRPFSSSLDSDMSPEPVSKRGWTLQENLLSPRTLSYGSDQMAWQCQECETSECGRPILADKRGRDKWFIQSLLIFRPSIGKRAGHASVRFLLHFTPRGWLSPLYHYKVIYGNIYSQWYAIVAQFCARNLTMKSDAFPALSGLAAMFQNPLHDQYCGGLWRYDMIRGLLWERWPFPNGKVPRQADLSRAAHHKSPSWS